MPIVENLFSTAQSSLKNQIETSRTTRTGILFAYEDAIRHGIDYDKSKAIYEKAPTLTLNDLKAFHQKNYANRKYNLMILGSAKKINLESLEKYGKLHQLTLEQIFGY